MDVYEVIESILDANGGEIKGRTTIQKLVYLAQNTIPQLEIPSYKPHYYGPFSSELGIALEKLVSYSFVTETKIPGTMYEGYIYRLTTDGQKVIDRIKNETKEEYEKIKELVDTCKVFCGLKTTPLSFASKIFYMLYAHKENHEKLTIKEAINNAKELGWNVSSDNVEQGAKLLEKLKLVKIS